MQAALAQRVTPAATPADVGVAALIQRGQQLYSVNCAPCHQSNGEGNLHQFPALNGNAFVIAQQPQPLIRTVLYGSAVMPSFAPTLSDEDGCCAFLCA